MQSTEWQLGHGAYWRHGETAPEQLHGMAASGHGITVLQATVGNWLLLASQGAPTVLDAHPWPGLEMPWAHQRRAAEFCLRHPRCLLALVMGAGKTLSSTWAALTLLRTGEIKRIVVVAPISIAGHVWQRQFEALGLRSRNLCGLSAAEKIKALADRTLQAIVLNPDGLASVERQLCAELQDLIIVDEARAFSNPSAQRSRLLRRLHAQRVWLLTGTPTPNSPMDALGYIRLITPTSPMSKEVWRSITMQQVTPWKWVPQKTAPATIAKHLQPAFYVPREECYDVPDVQDVWLDYDLSPEQERLSEDLIDTARVEFGGAQITAVNAAALMSKLLQIETGAAYYTDTAGRSVLTVPATDYYDRINAFVTEADTPVLIFAAFRATALAIHDHLRASGHISALVHGDTKQADRTRAFDDLQAGRTQALVAIPETAAHGITLTTARYVLWATPVLKNEVYMQGNARVVRPGQINNVLIAHMYGSKRSKTIFHTLQSKGNMQTAVLSLLE